MGDRFAVFVPTDPGLITCFVRVNVPGEGPRATTKLVRWNRVSIGELAVETQAGHRMLSFQLESQVLRGIDVEADRTAAFALRVIAAIDGRPLPPVEEEAGRRAPSRPGPGSGRAGAAAGSAARAARSSTKAPSALTRGAAPPARAKASSDAPG
jgi:hypothetical protein